MPAFPTQLPGPVWGALSGTRKPAFRRQPMAIGPARYVRTSTAPAHLVSVQWCFSATELAQFASWVHRDLRGGELAFDMPLVSAQGGVQAMSCALAGDYAWRAKGGGNYVVEAELEVARWRTARARKDLGASAAAVAGASADLSVATLTTDGSVELTAAYSSAPPPLPRSIVSQEQVLQIFSDYGLNP